MAKILSEQKHIESNTFQYEKRLQSSYNRFTQGNATYVTLYQINLPSTTVDKGWQDTEELLGDNSSLRFDKVENFPIFNIEQIVIGLNDEDQGLDGSFEGTGTFLPHTIKPLQNSFFLIRTINQTSDTYLFRIISIEYDNIHPDNYYKIGYKLESTDYSSVVKLENQVVNHYTCINENIGTDKACIIELDKYKKLDEFYNMYRNISDLYIKIFYNETYNTIHAYLPCSQKLYDPFLIEFINKHGLFRRTDEYKTLLLSQEVDDNMFPLKYEKSIFRFIERKDIQYISDFKYYTYNGININDSVFAAWYDNSIKVVDIPLFDPHCPIDYRMESVICDELLNAWIQNTPINNDWGKIIQLYIHGVELSIDDIPKTLQTTLIGLNASREFYYFTPIILYIMKDIYDRTIRVTDKIVYGGKEI